MAENDQELEAIETRGTYVGEMIKERVFTDRFLDAVRALRSDKSEITTLGVAHIQHERKAAQAPDLGQTNYSPSWPSYRSYWGRRAERIDHRAEVGDLDLNSLAMAVVNYKANRVPEAKPCVVTRKANGDEERDFNHPVAKLIRRPNEFHIWANYVGALVVSWCFKGDAHFYKSRSLTAIEELWYLPYFLVTPRWPDDGRSPDVRTWAREHGEKESELNPFLSHYEYRPPGKAPVLYPKRDILHLKRYCNSRNPREGVGVLEPLFKEFYSDDKMALFTASIMANMGIQVPVFSPKDDKDTIDDEDAAHMKELWLQKTTGDRAGEPVVMPVGVNVEKFGFNPTELDLSNLRMIPESRVAAVTGIPAATLQFMVGLQNGTSYASSEQARQQGFEEVILPLLRVWAEFFTWGLLRETEGNEEAEFEFDVSEVRVLQEDNDALYKRETSLLGAGGQTINETRTALGKKPVGPEGDVYLIPGLANPTTPDQLIAKADGSLAPEPIAPPDPASLAKFADIDRYLESLEKQMKEFAVRDR